MRPMKTSTLRDYADRLRAYRDFLDRQAIRNGGIDPSWSNMRDRFCVWLELRCIETERGSRQRREMARTSDPRRGKVVVSVRPSERRARKKNGYVPSGGPRNLWRTFPPR